MLVPAENKKVTGEIKKTKSRVLHDADIREPLFSFLEDTYGKIRIIEEKCMGRSRADVVMVLPGALVGVEIKSDADTYTRLDGQVKDYDRFCDSNYVVVGTSHAFHIEEHVPDYWGIITTEATDSGLDFYILRYPDINPKCDIKNKLSILWRPELAHIQELCSMPKYTNKSKLFVRNKILAMADQKNINRLISEELFERDYNTIDETIKAFRAEHTGIRKKRRRRRKFAT